MKRRTKRMLRRAGSRRNIMIGAGVAAGLTLGVLAVRAWRRRGAEGLEGPGELDEGEPLIPSDHRNGGEVVPQL